MATYKHGEKRQQEISEGIDAMERKIKERTLHERIKEKRHKLKLDLNRKTEACKLREAVNISHKQSIDFENTVGNAARL